jgi:hypothetical protein
MSGAGREGVFKNSRREDLEEEKLKRGSGLGDRLTPGN